MQSNASPLLTLSFTITPVVYEACVMILGIRMKKNHYPRVVVAGGLFTSCALGFLLYQLFYLNNAGNWYLALTLLLLVLDIYNLIYYPLLFEKKLRRRAASCFQKSSYFRQKVTLYFYEDCIDEVVANKKTRIQWASVLGVMREELFYMLRLTTNNGIIIPREKLHGEELRILEEILSQKAA